MVIRPAVNSQANDHAIPPCQGLTYLIFILK
jgi:hypothetical protein